MHDPADTTDPPASRTPLPALFLGSMLFVGLALLLHSQQGAVLTTTDRIAGQLDDEGKLRPLADIVETTRALKLVTVMVDSTVRTEVHDEGWRGRAAASVKAPVRYVYGVDLSGLDPDAIRMGHILGIYEITIPRPMRIAVEVDGSHPIEETVDVTGMRFRKVAGEYYQGLARKEIYEKARQSSLPDETLENIDTQTREQVESLVRRFVGPSAEVRVKYADKK
jgi:hypothetical protein